VDLEFFTPLSYFLTIQTLDKFGWLAAESTEVNAFLNGFRSSTSMVLFDRLWVRHRRAPMSSVYTNNEVLAVVSHEIGHWAHSHTAQTFIFCQVR